MENKIGIIAGNGLLPLIVIREAKKSGIATVLCAIEGETDDRVVNESDTVERIKVGQLGKIVKFFKSNNVTQAVMAGKITKTNLFKGDIYPDFEMIKVLAMTGNHSDDSLLGAIADYFEKQGIRILDSTTYLSQDCLPGEGVLTKQKPGKEQMLDVEYGWQLAKEMGRRDVGQTVVVKKQAVLAVEAIEGTDEAIRRGGKLGRGGVTVVKVAKPNQDMRFDVPAVGFNTISVMAEAGAQVLVFEAGKTILIERDEVIGEANRHKMCIIGIKK